MLNKEEVLKNVAIILVYIILILIGLTPIALARSFESDIYDQWNTLSEFEDTYRLRNFLIEKDWIYDDISLKDIDYILVLTEQCSKEFFPSVPTSLVLAIISVESGFNKNLIGFNNDIGLMQIIPKWHKDRIEKYIYEENLDMFDSRLNIMVGMDYLDELFEESRGDIEFVVTAYNAGPENAWVLHNKGVVSSYAREVLYRMNEIEDILERGVKTCLL